MYVFFDKDKTRVYGPADNMGREWRELEDGCACGVYVFDTQEKAETFRQNYVRMNPDLANATCDNR